MDASQLIRIFALVAIAIAIGHVVIGTAGRAGDVMATLFVPPDRALGWPHGVQERDEPWDWNVARPSSAASSPSDDDSPAGPADLAGLGDPRSGTFVVPVGRVTPVRTAVRPH